MLQQAHPGIATAADLLLGQTAGNSTVNATQNSNSSQTAAADQGANGAADGAGSGADSGAGSGAGAGAEGQGSEPDIPWRQVAGLLHSQGVTDPQGLVSSSPCTTLHPESSELIKPTWKWHTPQSMSISLQ